MGLFLRLWALCRGYKLVRLEVSPRGGGYLFITSPNLPGFSLMLHPDDGKSIQALSAALEGPLQAFIEAEYQAYKANAGTQRVHMQGIFRTSEANILAGYCTA
jgi:hypothetical protein